VNDPPPVAALSLSSVSGIAPLSLTASTSASTSQYSTVASSSINWGDGSTSSGPTASHAYSAAGNYTVTATVTDGFGVSSSVTQLVTVQAPYVLVTSPANGATVASPVPLAAQAFDGRKIASMTVLVDNVSVYTTAASALSASIPMAPGSHAVQVKAYEDATGAVYQSSLTVNVPALALTASLSLSATSGIAPVAVTATAGGADLNLNGSITAVSIQWGDGSASNGATASHTYATAGKYNVTATVTDNYGITSTATQTVTVQAPYVLITSPVPGATLASPVRVTAQAFEGRPIASMIVYVDSLKAYTIYAGALDAYIPMSSGSHTIKVKAWENVTGKVIESSTTVQVPQPATGVTVIAPTDGATVGSPVRFVASAASKRAIASMAIYVDSLKMYLAYSDWLDTSLAIASGTHRVQVKAWDKGGTLYQQTLYITVP
jgi:PKD repeat protein